MAFNVLTSTYLYVPTHPISVRLRYRFQSHRVNKTELSKRQNGSTRSLVSGFPQRSVIEGHDATRTEVAARAAAAERVGRSANR